MQERAKYRVNQKDLSIILYLLGLKEKVALKAITSSSMHRVPSNPDLEMSDQSAPVSRTVSPKPALKRARIEPART